MPLPMVHLSVAVLAEKELGIMNRSAYYLGSIAPDGIHMQEHWTGEDKKRSHLGVRGTDDPSGVMEFLTGGVLDTDRDYCIGYALHCLMEKILLQFFRPGKRTTATRIRLIYICIEPCRNGTNCGNFCRRRRGQICQGYSLQKL